MRIEQKGTKMRIELLPLTEIKRDPRLMLRVKMSQETVKTYAAALKRGDYFPPVEVAEVEGKLILTNGFHRAEAREKAGKEEIEAIITKRTWDQALLAAAAADNYEGLKRTRADKHKAVKAVLLNKKGQELSDRTIARLANVSPTFVGKIRGQLSTLTVGKRLGKDGKRRTVAAKKYWASKEVRDWIAVPMAGDPKEQRIDYLKRDLERKLRLLDLQLCDLGLVRLETPLGLQMIPDLIQPATQSPGNSNAAWSS
jgi:hypothetical protein